MVNLKIILYFLLAKFFRPRTKQQLLRLQSRRLRRTLLNACCNFESLKSLKHEPLTAFPVSTKKEFFDRFQDLNILGITHAEARARVDADDLNSDIRLGLSTGTSGPRSVFMTSGRERARWAATIISRCLPRLNRGQRVAFFLRADNPLYQSASSGFIHLKYFDLNGELPLSALTAFKPDVLIAPPYILAKLARRADLDVSPRLVISVADVLDPWDEQAIRKRFPKIPLHQIYQAAEGFLAATCERGSLHINEDLLYFERRHLDSTHFVPVITDFHRTSQAIVRLELSDVLKLSETSCGCGSPLTKIDRVDGRVDEILSGPNGPIFRGELAGALSTLNPADLAIDFRFTQVEKDQFRLAATGDGSAIASCLKSFLISKGIATPRIQIESELNLKPYEKRRRFLNRMNL